MEVLVDAVWLAGRLDRVLVADVRWYLDGRSGREAFEAGHVPGAVWVDLDRDLADPPTPARGRHPLPEPARFATAMGCLGLRDGLPVVAYDDAGGLSAGRLVWMLRVQGHDAALLDGGLAAWPGPLETGPAPGPARTFPLTVGPWPADRLAGPDDVLDAPGTVIDARAAERYRGEVEPVDPRPGHIPGARSVPYTDNLDPATGRWLDPAALRARYQAAGVSGGSDVIVYCGSGVTACHDLLALERAGLGPGRLYAGSWSQWSADPTRPAQTG